MAELDRLLQLTINETTKHTAVHEAGHAFVGRVLGLTCGHATIRPDREDDSAGHAIIFDPARADHDWQNRGRPGRYDSLFRASIMALMAGREAELACLGSCKGGDSDDLAEITFRCRSSDASLMEGDLPKLRRRTQFLCRRRRSLIGEVALQLINYETLDADSIDEIIRASEVWMPDRAPVDVPFELMYARCQLWKQGYGRRSFSARLENGVAILEW